MNLFGLDGGPNDGDQILKLDIQVARLCEIISSMIKTSLPFSNVMILPMMKT